MYKFYLNIPPICKIKKDKFFNMFSTPPSCRSRQRICSEQKQKNEGRFSPPLKSCIRGSIRYISVTAVETYDGAAKKAFVIRTIVRGEVMAPLSVSARLIVRPPSLRTSSRAA